MAAIASFLQSIKLPVMPEVAHALIRTLSDDDADIASVTAIIAKDPGLTATLMRMANSALFGLSHSVNTLDQAVSVVGTSHIRARALSICLANALVFPPGLHRHAFWRASMVCAGYAKWLAGSIGLNDQQAWLTGMMLRLGQVVIAQYMPDAAEHMEALPCGPGERWQRERALTGFDEGQITAEMARRWDFPEAVTLALQTSATPWTSTRSPLGAVVHLAAWITDQVTLGPQTLDGLPVSVVQSLGLNLHTLQSQMPNAESFSDISMFQG